MYSCSIPQLQICPRKCPCLLPTYCGQGPSVVVTEPGGGWMSLRCVLRELLPHLPVHREHTAAIRDIVSHSNQQDP